MATARTQDVVFNSYIGYDYSLSLDSKLGCNLSNTPILNTYPSGPTSSKGTYIFADAAGGTKILTAGGTNDKTGVTLDICSSSSAPYTVLTSNKNGTSVMKQIVTYDGTSNASLSADGVFFGGLNYKTIIENHSQNIQDINNVTVPGINDRLTAEEVKSNQLDSRLTTNEDLTSLHTSQIANLAAVDVTELAKLSDLEAVDVTLKSRLNVIEAKQPLVISIPIYHVPSVYADSTGRADYIPASVSAVTPYSGLYYKNQLNQKINWYIQPDVGMTVGDLKGLMLSFYNISAVTGLGCPFVAVYTKIDSVTPNAATWYKSRKTLCVEYTSTTAINTSYALLANLKSLPYEPLAYGHTKINATTIPGNDKGPFSDSEQILFFSIGTASNSAAGLFEFIASKFTLLTEKSTQEFAFQQL
jgi:hypothetical protein